MPSSDDEEKEKTAQLPTVAQCATHLKLLAAFYQIRKKVLNSTGLDAALGIVPMPRTVYRKQNQTWQIAKLHDLTFHDRRLAKWPLYLLLAAVRFLKWVWVVEALDEQLTGPNAAIMLPPIDVLMVWHALLLNPRWFESIGFKRLPRCPFPWTRVNEAIDPETHTWPYTLPNTSSTAFLESTLLEADLFKYLTSPNHSPQFKQTLTKHGLYRSDIKACNLLTASGIKKALSPPNMLGTAEVHFLKTYRLALNAKTSNLASNLVDAVQRQAAFVEKMENHLWIRSPALEGTLTRAVDRYSKFLKLFRLYPDRMLVPTLDIDLVWHTHQCSPFQYNEAMMKVAGRLIDHNDKLGKNTLNPGFERTADLFRMRFGLVYSRCHCWDCETLLSAIEDSRSRSRSKSKPRGEDAEREIAREVHRRVAYFRAVEIARRAGKTLLPLDDELPGEVD
ncbi:hypothetical protein BDW59DRAFT_85330 [Aspergillus cavernicola]|uniref:Glycine-rich domain-containing protein 1 n=1 Tax=Aspergillus cavernicola TaxID=176166 RepID=A0ABR4IBZ6_9EURO